MPETLVTGGADFDWEPPVERPALREALDHDEAVVRARESFRHTREPMRSFGSYVVGCDIADGVQTTVLAHRRDDDALEVVHVGQRPVTPAEEMVVRLTALFEPWAAQLREAAREISRIFDALGLHVDRYGKLQRAPLPPVPVKPSARRKYGRG